MNAFIEENKALIRRMFGDYHTQSDWFHPETREHFSSFHDGPDRKVKRAKRSIGPSPLTNNKYVFPNVYVEYINTHTHWLRSNWTQLHEFSLMKFTISFMIMKQVMSGHIFTHSTHCSGHLGHTQSCSDSLQWSLVTTMAVI